MKRNHLLFFVLLAFVLLATVMLRGMLYAAASADVAASAAPDSKLNGVLHVTPEEVRATFTAGPGKDFATAPLWVWNDLLTEEQVRGTLRDLASQRVMQAFVHPRPGLMTPYLSDDWFRLWRASLDEAAKLGMNLWIYDENSYPSGFAGGFVPEAMPESRGVGLVLSEVESLDPITDDVMFVWKRTDLGIENVTDGVKKGKKLDPGKWIIAKKTLAPIGQWFGNRSYVDILKPGVTQKFLEVTHEVYKRELGEHFGKGIRGVFTDEPHLRPAPGFHWTEDLPEVFQSRFGYSILEAFPQLTYEIDQRLSDDSTRRWTTVRHNYQQVLLEMMVERWCRPCYEWCEANGLEFTGHYWEHGWPGGSHGPDPLAFYLWHQRPAIDVLLNEWNDGVHAQVGNSRAVRELASIAHQTGRARTLSETYGAGGWDLRFEDMKRIGDWQYALGVNTTDEHLSNITMRGARKHDHPQSFSYQSPWWESYHVMAEYHTRVAYLVSQGVQENKILVIQPTTSAWMYEGLPKNDAIGQAFVDMLRRLDAASAEYDLGSEDVMARLGRVEREKTLTVGKAEYTHVIIPAEVETLNAQTVELLNAYSSRGGTITLLGEIPPLTDGAPSKNLLAERPNVRCVTLDELLTLPLSDQLVFFQPDASLSGENILGMGLAEKMLHREKLFHQRRKIDGGEILFVCNADLEKPASGSILYRTAEPGVDWSKVERLDLLTGKISDAVFVPVFRLRDDFPFAAVIPFQLPPCGSAAFLLTTGEFSLDDYSLPQPEDMDGTVSVIETYGPTAPPTMKRLADNALVLDFCDVTVKGETRTNQYFYAANDWMWKEHGFTDGNPWHCGVQYKDERIAHQFADDSGYTVSYHFSLDADYAKSLGEKNRLCATVESADRYQTVMLNGKPILVDGKKWRIDHSFIELDLTAAAHAGENELTLVTKPMQIILEIMPAILFGDFSVKPADAGFVVMPPRPLVFSEDVAVGNWLAQGLPFYGYDVAYTEHFVAPKPKKNERIFVTMPRIGSLEKSDNGAKWNGSVAKVVVNGVDAGHIFCEPCALDVTEFLTDGKNEVTVVLTGTPKNLFGPFHAGKPRGVAGPGHFARGAAALPAGAAYDFIPTGLLAPFYLELRGAK